MRCVSKHTSKPRLASETGWTVADRAALDPERDVQAFKSAGVWEALPSGGDNQNNVASERQARERKTSHPNGASSAAADAV